jgi:transcriptional repressor NrdR
MEPCAITLWAGAGADVQHGVRLPVVQALSWHRSMLFVFAQSTHAIRSSVRCSLESTSQVAVRSRECVYSNADMKCPFCRLDNDRVIDSRSSQDGLAIRRRRECLSCSRRFTTYERPEETTIKVIKKDGSRVPFEREKIKRGLERACWKRPINTRQIENTTTAIENDVYQHFESEVESRELGEIVMRYLRDLDAVAFVRFASVYRQFNDVYDFFEELKPMLSETPKSPR